MISARIAIITNISETMSDSREEIAGEIEQEIHVLRLPKIEWKRMDT